MRTKTILGVLVLGLVIAATPLGAQQSGGQGSGQGGGGLGGVLDALGGLLGGGSRKLHGTVVVSDGSTVVLRTDDRATYRIDVASLDPAARAQLTQGRTVTVTARGGQGGVLTATEIQADADAKAAATFQRVTGTVQEAGQQRVLFRTRDGLVLPVDVTRVHGLPYLAADQPATLYYEQGPKQEVVAVWIEPGTATPPSASQPSASPTPAPATPPPADPSPSASVGQTLEGRVQTIGISTLTVQTADGRTITVDTSGVDPQSVASVRPGDDVTVTGTEALNGGRFQARSVRAQR